MYELTTKGIAGFVLGFVDQKQKKRVKKALRVLQTLTPEDLPPREREPLPPPPSEQISLPVVMPLLPFDTVPETVYEQLWLLACAATSGKANDLMALERHLENKSVQCTTPNLPRAHLVREHARLLDKVTAQYAEAALIRTGISDLIRKWRRAADSISLSPSLCAIYRQNALDLEQIFERTPNGRAGTTTGGASSLERGPESGSDPSPGPSSAEGRPDPSSGG